jgi:hypothetical protein
MPGKFIPTNVVVNESVLGWLAKKWNDNDASLMVRSIASAMGNNGDNYQEWVKSAEADFVTEDKVRGMMTAALSNDYMANLIQSNQNKMKAYISSPDGKEWLASKYPKDGKTFPNHEDLSKWIVSGVPALLSKRKIAVAKEIKRRESEAK